MSMYAINDLRAAFGNLSGWSYLAAKRIQLENRRTWIGTAWVVLAFGLTSAGIGVIMAQLQGLSFMVHVPYVMFGFAAWNFIQNSVIAGCNVMVNAKPYLLQMKTARSVFPLSLTLRNLYLLILHALTAFTVSAVIGWRPTFDGFWALGAIVLYLPFGFAVGLMLGLVCARFRDIARLVESVMRLAFFFTPVIWVFGTRNSDDSEGVLAFLMKWNPFTYMLQTFRSGLIGEAPRLLDWAVTAGAASISAIIAVIALQALGRRVTYWL